jgi:uncharacterized protein
MSNAIASTVQTVAFTSDRYRLKGELHLPEISNPPIVFGSHGFLADRNSPKLLALADRCNRCGIGFFRFDHRGRGESEGTLEAGSSIQARSNDLRSAISFLQGQGIAKNRIGLFGSSMGGATVLATAAQIPIHAIVICATPIRNISPTLSEDDEDYTLLQGKHIYFDVPFDLPRINRILIFHGDKDAIVPIDHGKEIYARTSRPKQLIVQKGGDHRITMPIHQAAFVRESVYWFMRFLLPNAD